MYHSVNYDITAEFSFDNIYYITNQITGKMKKEKALEAIRELPEEFELEYLLEKLIFVEKVQQGLDQLQEGRTTTNENAKVLAKQW